MLEDVSGKRLLVLGGTSASLDLVKNARQMGVYTIVTDPNTTGVAKQIADECAMVSTADLEGLKNLIQERKIDGVFCGPSEFNLRNVIALCEQTGLPCYTSMEQWDRCANKDVFKKYCIEYGVDCPREFFVDENSTQEELEQVQYPVIVKPVDGSSSAGITVCMDQGNLREACRFARQASKSGRIVVETYVDNGGELFGARYILRDGEAYPYLLIDTYIVDPIERKSLISGFTLTPSKYADYYMEHMDGAVRRMLKGMGLKNGTAFFQALPYQGKIYFHEMGYRLSGGMIFKLTEPLMGVNDMKMMIRYALGGEMCTPQEQERLDVRCCGRVGAQLMIPLNAGRIAEVEGLEEMKALPCVQDFIQYYQPGDRVEERVIGTLGQHFGRFTFVAEDPGVIFEAVEQIQRCLVIRDTDGNIMNQMQFDLERTQA